MMTHYNHIEGYSTICDRQQAARDIPQSPTCRLVLGLTEARKRLEKTSIAIHSVMNEIHLNPTKPTSPSPVPLPSSFRIRERTFPSSPWERKK